MKANQLAVDKDAVGKAVHTKPVQLNLDGKEVPVKKEWQCPFTMTTCIEDKCRIWSEKYQLCNFELNDQILSSIRELVDIGRGGSGN
jgi:hypothetical protein